MTNAEINPGDVQPGRELLAQKELLEVSAEAGSPGIDTEHLNPSFLAGGSFAENSIQLLKI